MHKENWDDLRIALAVSEAGSVNAAANKLGVNHATVLRRLAAFEDRYGISLFQKSQRGYRVDPNVEDLLVRMHGVERAVDAFERSVRGHDSSPSGDVRITSTDSLCNFVLPNAVAELQRTHPDLRITLVSTNNPVNFSKLDADVTVRPANNLPPDLGGVCVCEMAFRAFASPQYLNRCPVPRHWLGVEGSLLRSPVGAWLAQTVPDQIVMRADSFVALAAIARSGLGAAVLPSFLGQNDPSLRRVATPAVDLRTKVWVATHPDVSRLRRVVAVTNLLTKYLSCPGRLISDD